MKRKKKEISTIQEARYSTTENPYLNEYSDHDDQEGTDIDGKEAGDQFRDLYWDEYADNDREPINERDPKTKKV